MERKKKKEWDEYDIFILMQQKDKIPKWKRILDYTLIIILSPILLIIGAGIALSIKLSSHGPILFCQQRIGLNGKEFTCYKFRTMHRNANAKIHHNYVRQLIEKEIPMIKLDIRGDTRLLFFGATLRATGLDELPQLINVLCGDMSIVGPRPCTLYEYKLYAPRDYKRFSVAPGLTGLWQVSGKNKTTFKHMIHLDIEYSQHFSIWLDLKIILKTFPTLIKQCLNIH